MKYRSTRSDFSCTASEAILRGIAPDGGLLVPDAFPRFSLSDIEALIPLSYRERAARVLGAFLPDYPEADLHDCLAAYGDGSFEGDAPAPLVPVSRNLWSLELWHGPTSAFKDMALTVLPRLLTSAMRRVGDDREALILVATSGDTGKAALAGFQDVPRTRVCVFYPDGGVSPMQRLQMVTQRGANMHVIAVRGNFDDAQTGVKRLFTDDDFLASQARQGRFLSSANSINWGRLVPQIAYYFSAYADLLAAHAIEPGANIRFAVPTGNFGNILAGYYAMRCGLPIERLVCASNPNRVLTDFFARGVYDARREFHATLSPSMDIVISSNLERLLFELGGRDAARIDAWMADLRSTGAYAVGDDVRQRLAAHFDARSATDAQTIETIAAEYARTRYVLDPHTAVGRFALGDEIAQPTVLVSTASPFKFGRAVLTAIAGDAPADEFACAQALEATTGWAMPQGLRELAHLPERFSRTCAPEDMRAALEAEIG